MKFIRWQKNTQINREKKQRRVSCNQQKTVCNFVEQHLVYSRAIKLTLSISQFAPHCSSSFLLTASLHLHNVPYLFIQFTSYPKRYIIPHIYSCLYYFHLSLQVLYLSIITFITFSLLFTTVIIRYTLRLLYQFDQYVSIRSSYSSLISFISNTVRDFHFDVRPCYCYFSSCPVCFDRNKLKNFPRTTEESTFARKQRVISQNSVYVQLLCLSLL